MVEKFSLLETNEYKITKPIRLIEFFAGIGAQAKALERLGANFEHYLICEWAIPSIKAYASIHRDYLPNYGKDYTEGMSKEDLENELFRLGISSDYNSPDNLAKIHRKNIEELKLIYNSIKWTNNKVDISRVHWNDLSIVEQEKYDYIMTYSFPCQDLSLAGKKAGMQKGSGTRSGLLWEVERILLECKEHNCLPKILLMENVSQIHSVKNVDNFKSWQESLRKMGYSSVWQDLNAKDCGIPQNRVRTFMISILGNYDYTFPKKQELKLKLKDMLEDEVDEKYYLSQKMVDCFMSDGTGTYPRKERFLQNINRENKDVGNAVTTLAGSRPTDNFVIDDKLFLSERMINYIASDNEKYTGNNDKSLVKNDVKDGDFIDAFNKQVKSKISGTITTRVSSANCTFVAKQNEALCDELIKDAKVNEGDVVNHSRPNNPVVSKDGIIPTITTRCDELGAVIEDDRGEDNDKK